MFLAMARPLDPTIDRAITEATLTLLRERGFARMSMESVASTAGVGKPAIYRRFRDKAALVATVIEGQLPQLEVPDVGDTRAELWMGVERGFPADPPGYVGLIGGLIAEQERHPELIEAFRRHVLLPRRAIARALIERGQARGDVRPEIPAVAALDLLAGPLLARVFAGEDTGPRWLEQAFGIWWSLVRTPQRNAP
jgi:AcrR family transcriptional regulator